MDRFQVHLEQPHPMVPFSKTKHYPNPRKTQNTPKKYPKKQENLVFLGRIRPWADSNLTKTDVRSNSTPSIDSIPRMIDSMQGYLEIHVDTGISKVLQVFSGIVEKIEFYLESVLVELKSVHGRILPRNTCKIV